MNIDASVLVSVRLSGGAYLARAGNGKAARIASSTNCGPVAATAAAAKYLGVAAARITLAKDSPGVFRARVNGASGQNVENKPAETSSQNNGEDVAILKRSN